MKFLEEFFGASAIVHAGIGVARGLSYLGQNQQGFLEDPTNQYLLGGTIISGLLCYLFKNKK